MPIRLISRLIFPVCSLWMTVAAFAHSDSQSTLQMSIFPDRIAAEWSISFRDFAAIAPKPGMDYASEFIARLDSHRDHLMELRADDRPIAASQVLVCSPSAGAISVSFNYPLAAEPTDLQVRCLCLELLATGHHQVLTIEDHREGRVGQMIDQQTICIEQDTAVVELPLLPDAPKNTRKLHIIPTAALNNPLAFTSSGAPRTESFHFGNNIATSLSVLVLTITFLAVWCSIRIIGKGRLR